ncbi:MAG: hypothetical protein ACJ754_18680 [Pyrinomonadaceae bacterium]
MSRVVLAHAETDPDSERSGVEIGSDPVRATVTYTGLSRPTPLAERRFITSYVLQDETPEDRSGFATEMLFRESKAEFWLLVRDELVPRFRRELRRGESVELYAVWVGTNYPMGGKRRHIFLINEFKKPGPRRGARAAAGMPDGWYAFAGPDGDFTLRFPSKPEQERDSAGLISTIRRYTSTNDSFYFGIDYEDVGPAASVLKPDYEETVSALLQDRGNKVVSIRRQSKNSTQMELWSPSRTPGKFTHRIDRITMSHGRRYTTYCGSRLEGREVDKELCRRFFDSLRVIRPPQLR